MLIVYSILLSIAAFTYSEIITQPGMILSRPYEYVDAKLPEWLAKPLMTCCKCVAGQWALWLFPIYLVDEYSLIVHLWFILQSIFNAAIVRAAYYKIIGVQNVRATFNISKAPTPPELKN